MKTGNKFIWILIMNKIITSLILFSISFITFSQVGYSPRIDSICNLLTQQKLALLNRELSGDTSTIIGGVSYTLLSRYSSSVHNPKAAQFILERFQSFGLSSRYMDYRSSGTNVIAVKTGTKYPNKQYIICGHYDDMPSGSLAPGADDNASGTCAVLEAARLLAPYSFDYTLVFIAFDEEELGLIGSRAYADTAYNRGDSIMGVLNFDMIAWDSNNDNKIHIFSNSNSVPFATVARYSFNIYQPLLDIVFAVSNMSGSDHYYFWQRGYKAFCGIEYNSDFNTYYHTVNDKFSNINIPYFYKFTKAAIAALMTFGWDYTINFTHTPVTASDTGPKTASVVISSVHKIKKLVNGPKLYYRVNGGSFSVLSYDYNNLDTFRFTIPGQSYGSSIDYYFAAQDSLANFVGTLPMGGKGLNPPGSVAPPTFLQYQVLTGIAANSQPYEFSLSQNYPNPFNPQTNITFSLAEQSNVKVVIYDMLGRETLEIINGKYTAGTHNLMFDGKNFSSGVYFYTMFINGEKFDTKKMMLIK